ncbi:hypothetical protein [Mesorhizobium sp. M1396]|uniref:hypothetical protein n=1 Tax=Mesorhizobium sp. M1396 TaxID=2957095 RepID=UPI003337AB99
MFKARELASGLFGRRAEKTIDGEHGVGVAACREHLAYRAQLSVRVVQKLEQIDMIQTALHRMMSRGRSEVALATGNTPIRAAWIAGLYESYNFRFPIVQTDKYRGPLGHDHRTILIARQMIPVMESRFGRNEQNPKKFQFLSDCILPEMA